MWIWWYYIIYYILYIYIYIYIYNIGIYLLICPVVFGNPMQETLSVTHIFACLLAQGSYAYIETSSPRLANDTANLFSPKLTISSVGCLTFWYHMFGPDINSLAVVKKVSPDKLKTLCLWNCWLSAAEADLEKCVCVCVDGGGVSRWWHYTWWHRRGVLKRKTVVAVALQQERIWRTQRNCIPLL